jgi:toxin ParE1/3/4
MAVYELTRKAENEIERIYEYSIVNFGLTVAHDYLVGLHECFQLLADHQSFGTDYGFIKSGLFRYEYRSHSIYYKPTEEGILIVRVLGGKQDPARHISE